MRSLSRRIALGLGADGGRSASVGPVAARVEVERGLAAFGAGWTGAHGGQSISLSAGLACHITRDPDVMNDDVIVVAAGPRLLLGDQGNLWGPQLRVTLYLGLRSSLLFMIGAGQTASAAANTLSNTSHSQ